MTPQTALPVDPHNPGQVLACCGLIELLARHAKPVASSFDLDGGPRFLVALTEIDLVNALDALAHCNVSNGDDDSLSLGQPFDLRLDWWLDKGEGVPVPKTWAGGVKPATFFRPYQAALKPRTDNLHQWWRVSDFLGSASPGLDPREFTHSLDTGFSLYDTEVNAGTFPYVNILAFIGLQRFRPNPDQRGVFSYTLWQKRVLPSVAALTFAGHSTVGAGPSFLFRLRSRDQKNRYKAFSFAEKKGGNP